MRPGRDGNTPDLPRQPCRRHRWRHRDGAARDRPRGAEADLLDPDARSPRSPAMAMRRRSAPRGGTILASGSARCRWSRRWSRWCWRTRSCCRGRRWGDAVPRRKPGPRPHLSQQTPRPPRTTGLGPGLRRGTALLARLINPRTDPAPESCRRARGWSRPAHRAADQLLHPADIFDRRRGQIGPAARALRRFAPALDRLVDRLDRRLVRGVGREVVVAPCRRLCSRRRS